MNRIPLAVALAAGFVLQSRLEAQTIWNDSATDWNSAGSWDAGVPTGATIANLPNDASIGFQPTLTANGSALGLVVDNTGADYTIGGAGFVLDLGASGIVSTGAGNLTIQPTLNLSASQSWNASTGSGNIVRITGNLTGASSVVLTISSATASNTATVPNVRLAGNNSGFTGNIAMGGSTFGILLESPSAMTGGVIDISGGNSNVWLASNTASNPYVFGTANTTGSANINFRNAGTAGLFLTGGDVYWDPGNGSDYSWAAGSNGHIRLGGTNDAVPRMLFLGNTSSNLTLIGDRSLSNAGAGNFSGYVTIRSALADDAGGGRNFNTSAGLAILTRAAVNDANPGNTTVSGGALSVSNMNQIFDGWLNLSGGVLVLDNVSWSDFTTDRSAGYRASNATNTWGITGGGGGFAARGSDVAIVIDNANPASAYGTITANAVFDRSFTLGSSARNPDGTLYAANEVDVQQHTVLSGVRTVTVASNGLGFAPGTGVVNRISGNLSGTGALIVTGASNTAGVGTLVLSGVNTWTGNVSSTINTGTIFNSGLGGMQVSNALLRFDGDASMPNGNGGGATAAFLGAVQRNSSSPFGYLLTGNATGITYDLADNYRFMIGSMSTAGSGNGTLGADLGRATLRDSTVLIHAGNAGADAQNLHLLVRDNAELTLGTAGSGNAVRLVPSTGQSGAGSTTATTVSDAAGTRTLIKRGEGTLVLQNVAYTDVAEAGNTAAQFSWQIGNGASNSIASPYFDGAVRETGNGSSNSLTGFNVLLTGGVLETNDTLQAGGFVRALGTGTTQVRWGSGGGGFAAYGGNLTVNINATPTNTEWGDTNFLSVNGPLIFGSQTANGRVEFQNTIGLATGTGNFVREIRVIDNPNSAADLAVMSGNIHSRGDGSGGGTGTRNLTKTGNGTLVLAGGNNTYNGDTVVAAGTLLVNGVLTANGTTNPVVNVAAGATLGGNGTINRAVSVAGTLAPGNSPGILNTNNLTLAGNSTFALELNGTIPGNGLSNHDQVNVTGTVTLGGSASDRITLTLNIGYPVAVSDVFVVINNDSTDGVAFGGGTNGLFRYSGNDLNDGDAFNVGAYTFEIDYTYNGGGDGNSNDVALIVTAIPEPSVGLMMVAGFGLMALFRRRSA